MGPVCITVDIDWAPDDAIDLTADLLIAAAVPATWFVTHDSPAVRRLAGHRALFELGVHPNFLSGSSHGGTIVEVLDHCMTLVPGARSLRTHALHQSTPIFDAVLSRTPWRLDASLFLPYARHVEAIEHEWKGTTLLRIPYVWEDDVEMLRHMPTWSPDRALEGTGPRVFDFHPIHVALNSADMGPYERLKGAVSPLHRATLGELRPFVNRHAGSQTVLRALLDRLTTAPTGTACRLGDLYDAWVVA